MNASVTQLSSVTSVQLIGYLNGGFGLGETGRLVVKALRSVGIEVDDVAYEVDYAPVAGDSKSSKELKRTNAPCIFSSNGDLLSHIAPRLGTEFFWGRPVIGIWFWETECPPRYAQSAYGLVDEIWTCSEFVREAFQKGSDVPVRVFPHPFDLEKIQSATVPQDFRWEGSFVYLFTFDFNSSMNRKNPMAVCEAFIKAFPEEGKPMGPGQKVPLLVIKSINMELHRMEAAELKEVAKNRSDIVFIDGYLPTEEKNGLAARADCYVSLHRSEGLGMTIMEAMALGKPCIATGYSGNMSFMNEGNSFPVRYDLVSVGPGDMHYPESDKWAQPDTAHAAQLMIEVALNPERAALKGQRARRDIESSHSLAHVGKKLAGMLEDVAKREPLPKSFELLSSFHKRATQRLNALKSKLKTSIKSQPKKGHVSGDSLIQIRKEVLELIEVAGLTLKSLKEKENTLRDRVAMLEVASARNDKRLSEILEALERKNGDEFPKPHRDTFEIG